jgi:hypothetical protein
LSGSWPRGQFPPHQAGPSQLLRRFKAGVACNFLAEARRMYIRCQQTVADTRRTLCCHVPNLLGSCIRPVMKVHSSYRSFRQRYMYMRRLVNHSAFRFRVCAPTSHYSHCSVRPIDETTPGNRSNADSLRHGVSATPQGLVIGFVRYDLTRRWVVGTSSPVARQAQYSETSYSGVYRDHSDPNEKRNKTGRPG